MIQISWDILNKKRIKKLRSFKLRVFFLRNFSHLKNVSGEKNYLSHNGHSQNWIQFKIITLKLLTLHYNVVDNWEIS